MNRPRLLTPDQVATALNMTADELTELRRTGLGPSHLVFSSRTIRYRPAAVSEWLQPRDFPRE